MIEYDKISAFESEHDCIVYLNESAPLYVVKVHFVDGEIITREYRSSTPIDFNKLILDTLAGIDLMIRLKWGELIV
jgi:hypothetical protein